MPHSWTCKTIDLGNEIESGANGEDFFRASVQGLIAHVSSGYNFCNGRHAMKMVETMLFERPGKQNTGDCVKAVLRHIKDCGKKHVVVASTSGTTAMTFHEALKGTGADLIIVTHSIGFKEPGHDEFDADIRRRLSRARVPIHTGTILTHSLEKSLMDNFRGVYPGYLIAHTLRRFGEGTKVAIEVVMEACDAGLVPEDEEVIGIGGTARGSDTVLLIRSKPSKRFLELDVLEILARPRGRAL